MSHLNKMNHCYVLHYVSRGTKYFYNQYYQFLGRKHWDIPNSALAKSHYLKTNYTYSFFHLLYNNSVEREDHFLFYIPVLCH